MAKRHRDAIAIQAGACNALAVANALCESIRAVREEGGDWNATHDPAVQLILHQLAFLVTGRDMPMSLDYSEACDTCERFAKEVKT